MGGVKVINEFRKRKNSDLDAGIDFDREIDYKYAA